MQFELTEDNTKAVREVIEQWGNDLKGFNDPVFFIEDRIKVAGFPLILNPEVSEFVGQLKVSKEVTAHNVGKGKGLTTGILAYLVWYAFNVPDSKHIIVSPRYEQTMESLIHVAAMARSIGPSVVKKVGTGIEFANGSVIEGVSVTALGNAGRGLTLESDTLAVDGFPKLKASLQAEIAYRLSTDLSGKFRQTILV